MSGLVCRRGLDLAFLDTDGMCVVGVDSVVVEGWSSGFVVG